jgi:NADPH2:quinone reductase
MKAIRVSTFGDPSVLRMAGEPVPLPGPGRVLVRIQAAGVNPVDTYIRAGSYARKPALPYTPGADGAGVVEAVGADVEAVAPGERVYVAGSVTGTYAEYAVCEEGQVHRLPAAVSFAQGAAIGVPYATAWRALLQRARAKRGETVLVHGASGGVGTAAVQIGRAHGLDVLGTAGTPAGRQLVLEQGARCVFDHGSAECAGQVRAATGGRGVDIVIEMAAHVNLGRDLAMLAPGGRVVVVGSRGSVQIDPRDAMTREAEILGLLLFNASEADLAAIHTGLAAGLESGALSPVVGRSFPLEQAAEAHRAVLAPGAAGKIVLVP